MSKRFRAPLALQHIDEIKMNSDEGSEFRECLLANLNKRFGAIESNPIFFVNSVRSYKSQCFLKTRPEILFTALKQEIEKFLELDNSLPEPIADSEKSDNSNASDIFDRIQKKLIQRLLILMRCLDL